MGKENFEIFNKLVYLYDNKHRLNLLTFKQKQIYFVGKLLIFYLMIIWGPYIFLSF